jgi:hypothetical protein
LADQDRPAADPQAEPEAYDRWSRRQALSGRGYVLAVLIPLLIAAAGFGLVALLASGNDAASRVRVPTSDWIPGQPVGSTRIEGQLSSDSRHCVYLQGADGQQVWPVWPAGYYGELDSQGNVSLYDDKHQLVARSGQRVQASGASVSSAAYTGEACLPDDHRVELVQSEVVATR